MSLWPLSRVNKLVTSVVPTLIELTFIISVLPKLNAPFVSVPVFAGTFVLVFTFGAVPEYETSTENTILLPPDKLVVPETFVKVIVPPLFVIAQAGLASKAS